MLSLVSPHVSSADIKDVLSRPITAQVLCALLALVLLWQWSQGMIGLVSLNHVKQRSLNQATTTTPQVQYAVVNAGLHAPFFGIYVPNSLQEGEVKPSQLRMKVVGILLANTQKASHVMIQLDDGVERSYQVGDILPGGAAIKRITASGVLLWQRGELERLSLPKSNLTFEPPAKPLVEE